MAKPTTSLATLRPDLAGSLEQFDLSADREGFIGLRVAPVVEVARQAGSFGRIKLEDLLQNRETRRAPGAGYARGKWKFDTLSYATEENGWEEPIDDREAKMYADYFDAEMMAVMRARDIILRGAERRYAAMLYDPAVWTGSSLTTGLSNEWDDYANAAPIDDVNAARQKVWGGCGLWPNALIINRKQFLNLRECEQIQDRIAGQGAGTGIKASEITAAQLAMVFDLDQIIVAGGAQNTANEEQARSISQIWSDEYAMVARIARTRDHREPAVCRTFHWGEDGSQIGSVVESYRDETIRGDVVRARHDTDELVIYKECAHLLSNVTTI